MLLKSCTIQTLFVSLGVSPSLPLTLTQARTPLPVICRTPWTSSADDLFPCSSVTPSDTRSLSWASPASINLRVSLKTYTSDIRSHIQSLPWLTEVYRTCSTPKAVQVNPESSCRKKKKNNHIQEKHCDRLGDERFRWYKVSSESLAPRTDCPHWTSLCRKGVIQFLKTTGLLGYFGDNGCGSITKVFGAAVRHGPLTASEGTKQHRYGFSLPHSGYEDVEASLGTTLERFKPITKLCLKIEHAQQTHY